MTRKIPNHKFQITSNTQYPNFNTSNNLPLSVFSSFGHLDIGNCLEIGHWNLEVTSQGGVCG